MTQICHTLTVAIALSMAACAMPQAPDPGELQRPRIERSAAARAAFVRAYPCPVTGRTRGACPGWVVDHVVPLCAGGEDHPGNMQWQEREASYVKDTDERRLCRRLENHPWKRP